MFVVVCVFLSRSNNSGCEGVQVEELWSLDAEQFKDLSYVQIDLSGFLADSSACFILSIFYHFQTCSRTDLSIQIRSR